MLTSTARIILAHDNHRPAGLIRGWHLDGAGPARYGWAYHHPCRVEYIGRTLADVTSEALATIRENVPPLLPHDARGE